MKEYAILYVRNKNEKDIAKITDAIMETGIKVNNGKCGRYIRSGILRGKMQKFRDINLTH